MRTGISGKIKSPGQELYMEKDEKSYAELRMWHPEKYSRIT